MILSDKTIRRLDMVTPFAERTLFGGMSYGLGPAGYDVRVRQALHLPAGGFIRASTIERLVMPRSVMGWIADKSSWVRRGLCVQNSKAEPGWCGHLTLELTNHGEVAIDIAAGMPIAQVVFMWLDEPTAQPYAGKYQDQPDRPVEAIDEL